MESQPPASSKQGDYDSIFDLALRTPLAGSADAHALSTLFDIDTGIARCRVGSLLGAKYGTISDGTCCLTLASLSAGSLSSSKQ